MDTGSEKPDDEMKAQTPDIAAGRRQVMHSISGWWS
jgi:hypothetical protein